jgi:hypothetical protein
VCTCGYARYGRLGHGTSDDHSFDTICKPVSRFTGARVSSLACGAAHNVLLLSDSRTFVWGKCHYGQLDLGHEWMVRHHHARPFAYSVVYSFGRMCSVPPNSNSMRAVLSSRWELGLRTPWQYPRPGGCTHGCVGIIVGMCMAISCARTTRLSRTR